MECLDLIVVQLSVDVLPYHFHGGGHLNIRRCCLHTRQFASVSNLA